MTTDPSTAPDPVRLRDGREPMLHGRLVYLRPAEREDLPLFVRWLGDARTTRTLAVRSPLGLALEERWFEHALDRQGRDAWHFVICRLEDDRPIGTIAFDEVDLDAGNAWLGIAIGDPADTDLGYGTDALRAMVAFGFGQLRLERIALVVYAGNERAVRAYRKAGFVPEGIERHALFRDGRHVDTHVMGILREEWLKL